MAGDEAQTELLRRLIEGILGDDGVGVLDDVTTASVTFEAVTGETFEGREVVKEVVAESMATYDEFELEFDWTVADGDRIVASTRTTAKTREGILGIPPQEDTLTIDTIFDGRVEDGRIDYLRQVFDTRQMMPMALRRGRGAVMEQMRDVVVVLDDRELVVDANPAALDVLDADRESLMGEPITDVLGLEDLDVEPGGTAPASPGDPPATATSGPAGSRTTEPTEIERDGRFYEVRVSSIVVESEEPVGHTLVARDVTERERRRRQLAEQRDELERLSDLNSVLRGVNQALVAATSREEIDRAVSDRLADTDLYDGACVADVQTWAGDADRWTIAGDRDPTGLTVPELDRPPVARSDGGASVRRTFEPTIDSSSDGTAVDPGDSQVVADDVDDAEAQDSDAGESAVSRSEIALEDTWIVVPLLYGSTVYGALGLCTGRETVTERERAVLLELGDTIGHAINGVETRRLLSAEATVSLELDATDDADPLVVASENDANGEIELEGLVPAAEGRTVVYLHIDAEDSTAVANDLETAAEGAVRIIETADDGTGARVEWTVAGDAPLAALVEFGAHVRTASATAGTATYAVDVASDADVRSLVDRLRRRFPGVRLVSKAERSGPPVTPEAIPGPDATELTQRQREALETAYRSGYFAWPRDSTAEEVAESLDVAPSTLHSHLRKAEASVLASFFEDDAPDGD